MLKSAMLPAARICVTISEAGMTCLIKVITIYAASFMETEGAFHFYSLTSRTNRDKLMQNGTTFPD